MNLTELVKPFPEGGIEWRIGSCGKKGNGRIWATCLAYIQARAIQDRLDEVCGPESWKVSYRFIHEKENESPSVICELSIRCPDPIRSNYYEWVTKEDGSEQTDIESFKGGISSALKRAGSAWGIGRYLYGLDTGFAEIVEKGTPGAMYAKTKDGNEFYWIPPRLPEWALPLKIEKDPYVKGSPVQKGIHPEQPPNSDGLPPSDSYRITFGKHVKKSLEEVGPTELGRYINYLNDKAQKEGQPIKGQVKEFIERATAYIVAFEQSPIYPESGDA